MSLGMAIAALLSGGLQQWGENMQVEQKGRLAAAERERQLQLSVLRDILQQPGNLTGEQYGAMTHDYLSRRACTA